MHVCEFRIDTTDYYFSLFCFFLPFLNYSVCFFCFLLHYTWGLADQVTSALLPFRIMHLYWSDSEALVTTLQRVWGAHYLVCRLALERSYCQVIVWGVVQLPIGSALTVTHYALFCVFFHQSHISQIDHSPSKNTSVLVEYFPL